MKCNFSSTYGGSYLLLSTEFYYVFSSSNRIVTRNLPLYLGVSGTVLPIDMSKCHVGHCQAKAIIKWGVSPSWLLFLFLWLNIYYDLALWKSGTKMEWPGPFIITWSRFFSAQHVCYFNLLKFVCLLFKSKILYLLHLPV